MSELKPHDTGAIEPGVIRSLQALLCDADGNLFPSEEPAFVASADVTNELLGRLGITRFRPPEELRLTTTGMTFRRTVLALAAEHGITEIDDLEGWVEKEKQVVTDHLRATLRPDPAVQNPLTALSAYLPPAAVSSSALTRVQSCIAVTALDGLIPADRIFSAEDSLPVPTSKPDPAVYLHACDRLGIAPETGLAVEDSIPGATSAVAAGCPTVGNVLFVPAAEREERIDALYAVGVLTVVSSWQELADLLLPTLQERPALPTEAR